MPSHSPAQARTMAAIAHGWKPTQGPVSKIPVSVAKDFNKADAGTKRLKEAMMKRKTKK